MTQEHITLEEYNREFRRRKGHANLGKQFETMLNRAHVRYEASGLAVIYNVPNAFNFCSEGEYARLMSQIKARLGDGRTMKRVQTPCDFIGCVGRLAVAFDAKQFSNKSIALKEFKPHQVEGLAKWEQIGALAGFMVYAAEGGEVFWLKASQVREAQARVMYARKGKAAHPKSFSVGWLKENALFVGVFHEGQPCLWLEALTGAKEG